MRLARDSSCQHHITSTNALTMPKRTRSASTANHSDVNTPDVLPPSKRRACSTPLRSPHSPLFTAQWKECCLALRIRLGPGNDGSSIYSASCNMSCTSNEVQVRTVGLDIALTRTLPAKPKGFQ